MQLTILCTCTARALTGCVFVYCFNKDSLHLELFASNIAQVFISYKVSLLWNTLPKDLDTHKIYQTARKGIKRITMCSRLINVGQAKYNNSTRIEAATSGTKRLETTTRGHYPVSIHEMAPPERDNTRPIIQLTTHSSTPEG